MTDTTQIAQTEADRIAAFVAYVESIDAVDLDNVASGGIHSRVVDFGFVSHVSSFADSGTTVIDGSTLTMQAHVEIHMNDQSVIRMDVTVVGCDEDEVLGLRDIRPVETRAA